ncbi:MAG: hypothetical protein JJT88_11250 [Gammaproteobacteria bacterium]|nr:hypothetical protein [Gammaproteobacteria bacterium]
MNPLTIALGYAALATIWLLATDLLAGSVAEGSTAHMLNGLAFVLGTAGALFLLLRRLAQRDAAHRRNLDTMARAYRLLFEGHPLPSWVCDPDSSRVLAANAAAVKLNRDGAEVVGRTLPDLLGRDPDDDSTLVQSQGPHSERAFRLLSVPCTFADRPAILYLAHELTEERLALDRANRYSEEMRLLTRRLINAQEAERRAIARQLHDQLGQTLTVARLLVESTLDQIEDTEVRAMLREAMAALESGLKETRTLTGNLRPPMLDDLGIVPTLRWLVDRSTAETGVIVTLDLPADPGPLVSEIDVALYRIAQEAISNALQHGAPEHLKVRLRLRNAVITLSVEDDGRGFDAIHVLQGLVPFGRSGLLGARERAESLGGGVKVRSHPGQGTVVRAILPHTPPARAAQ